MFVFAGNIPGDEAHLVEIGNTISHEAGHAYGLRHYLEEPEAIMGTPDDFPFAGPNEEEWWRGVNDLGLQPDDVALLTDVLGAA